MTDNILMLKKVTIVTNMLAVLKTLISMMNQESDNDDDVLYQLCESEPVVERAQAKSTCKSKQSLLLQSDRQQLSKSSGSAKALKKSQDKQSKAGDSCSRQSYGKTNVQTSQPMSKTERRIADDELNSRSRVQRSDLRKNTNHRLMQILQHAERSGRAERKASPSPCMKKPYRHYERSVSPAEFFSDDEANEYPRRQHDSRKQLKITNRNVDSERELPHGRQKLAGRDASKENRYLSDDTRKSNHRQRRSVTKDRHRVEFSPSPSGYTKKSSHRYERSFSRDGYCSDSEDEDGGDSSRQFDGGKQSKSLKRMNHRGDSYRELAHRLLKLADQELSQENYYSSDEEAAKSKGKRDYRCMADSRRKSPKRHYNNVRGRFGQIKPPKFDGNSSFETFLIQFDNCAEHNHWDELDKLHFLRSALTETATQMLLGTEGMSYSQ